MNKKLKKELLESLVLAIILIIIEFVEIETFSFCVGATFIMILGIIEKIYR